MKSLVKVLKVLLLAGATVVILPASAQQEGSEAHHPEQALVKLARHLDLDAAQREIIRNLLEQAWATSSEDRSRVAALREELKVQQLDFDAGEAQRLADEIGEITTRLVFNSASTHAQIYQSLDESQQIQYQELQENREERWKRWRQHRQGGVQD